MQQKNLCIDAAAAASRPAEVRNIKFKVNSA